jgi:hypothetical protein
MISQSNHSGLLPVTACFARLNADRPAETSTWRFLQPPNYPEDGDQRRTGEPESEKPP